MPIEAYQIGISFVSDASRVQGATDALVRGLEKVLQAEQRAQMGFNDMVSAMRGAARVATSLATTMAQVAKSAQDAAAASARIKPVAMPSSGNAGPFPRAAAAADTVSTPSPTGSYVSPYSAAATAIDGQQRLLTYAPLAGTGLVPLGPATGGGEASFANPSGSIGDLVPYAGVGGGSVATRTGFTMPPGAGGTIPLAPLVPGTGALFAGKLPRLPSLPALTPGMKLLGGYLSYETLRHAFEAGADADDIKALMAAVYTAGPDGKPVQAFDPARLKRADSEALQMQRDVPGMGYAEALKIIAQTSSNLGSSDAGMAVAPKLALYSQVLSRIGHGDAIQQVEAAVQAGEIKGLNGKDGQIDTGKEVDFIGRLVRTAVSMNGTFDLQKFLTGFKQAGAGADAMSMDFATAIMPAYGKIMGEVKTGTALASLQQVLFAPVPKTRADRYAKEQEKLGLRLKDGELPADQAAKLSVNPHAYMLEEVLPRLVANGFTTPAQIAQEMMRLLPRQTVDRLGITSVKDQDLLKKEIDRNLAQQAKGDQPLIALLANAPGNQFKAFTESIRTLEAVTTDAAMAPMVDALKHVTASFQNVSAYVKDHPDDIKSFARDLDDIVKAIGWVAKELGDAWGIIPAPIKALLSGGKGLRGPSGFLNDMDNSADGLWGIKIPKGYHKGLFGQIDPDVTVQQQSYETGPTHMQPLNISLVMPNGDVLARHQETYQTRRAARPSAAGNAPDPMEVPFRPGSPLVAA